MTFFAPCPPGSEQFLARELTALGAGDIRVRSRGVSFHADLRLAYTVSVELRTASRILLELSSAQTADEDELYRFARSLNWEEWFDPQRSISCRVTGVPKTRDPRFAALRLKDAVADRFTQIKGRRPSVDRRNPDVRIEARWDGRNASVFLNWSGAPLHERGYRLERTEAVLRETTAAVVLAMAGWPDRIDGSFVDPVCGSGTLLAEAAMMRVNAPPGIHRRNWGFEAFRNYDEPLWVSIRNDAAVRYGQALERLPMFVGFDSNPAALKAARGNLRRAGLHHKIRLEQHDIRTGRPSFWPRSDSGLIFADPPYGVRSTEDPRPVYEALGTLLRGQGAGWSMAVLAPDRKTVSASCLRAREYRPVISGGMDLVLGIYSGRNQNEAPLPPVKDIQDEPVDLPPDPQAPSVRKILQKNLAAMKSWASKTGTTSYRIWDTDLPEFNAAADWYEGRWLHVQEFAAPKGIPPEKARRRLDTLIGILKEETGGVSEVFLKTRKRGIRPYTKLDDTQNRWIMRENGRRFFINLTDYLDTGIFLDHRPTRKLIEQKIGSGRFLNLFAYTGTASVMAASGGASSTVSVDTSPVYLNWARDNFRLNRMESAKNELIRSDCFEFLKKNQRFFDLIFIDPPTYSNGSGRKDWSVQNDHVQLIRMSMKFLNKGGLLIFAENYKQFRLSPVLSRLFRVREITRDTTDPDFIRRAGAHRCWMISHQK